MTQDEGPSVTGVTFIGKFQKLEITQTSFEPVATFQPGVYQWRNVKQIPFKEYYSCEKLPCKNE